MTIHLNEAEWEQAEPIEAEPSKLREYWPEITVLVFVLSFVFASGFMAAGQLLGWGK